MSANYFAASAIPLPLVVPAAPGATFFVPPMTQADYEAIGFELFRHNILPISQETFRAHFIEEIFRIHGDEQGEELANLMDEHWQAQDLYNNQVEEWKLQEEQRLLDWELGVKKPQAMRPQHTQSVREKSKAAAFADDCRRASPKLRDLSVEMQQFNVVQREGMTRIVLCGWDGLTTPYRKTGSIVPEETWYALKAEIGKDAVEQLLSKSMSMGSVDKTEKGNSASPPESESAQTGSPEQSEEPASSDGSSMASPTGPAPTEESVQTTKSQLSSTTSYLGAIQSEDPSPTAVG